MGVGGEEGAGKGDEIRGGIIHTMYAYIGDKILGGMRARRLRHDTAQFL